MKYKVIGTRGVVPFEISGEMIDDFIKRHCYADEIQWREYLLDESGNMCGLKGLADSGHGYGFYCTICEKQAKRWAITKRKHHIVNKYEHKPDPDLKTKVF